ncbi:MAG: hypothetical protein PSU93_11740 [Methylobacter sp.]|uniref:Glycoside hydrolase family 57 N-terminal domain-containing protein n=1 Tax=Candidatus Methylobacter titanis TaxID=3053457 RepID=A0AA43Q8M6_9GAMM|nr:hypothetical protein [Candidatus Methylobacter titanis]
MAQGYLMFHLNLAFSSIKAEARPEVIRHCYWPLLELAESTGIPIGIELTGWTLQQIALLDKAWVERFRRMLENHQCELIGSGWSQIIGPLVPYEVNRWNQKLGIDAYVQLLGITPKLALVNEMAFSTGMVDMYAEAGYEGIVMDRDNVRLAQGLDHAPLSAIPAHALGCGDQSLPVLWSDSILFQRLQRVVHGDIPISEYMVYVKERTAQDGTVLPIYCNDAEIFDYRPGRFTAESRLHPDGEWARLKQVCSRLKEDLALDWLSPGEALALQAATPNSNIRRLTSVSQPIPVKKQAKYNINRWAVTGRDDLWLNTSCHQIHQALTQEGDVFEYSWRELCELWASDLRTHITIERWDDVVERVSSLNHRLGLTHFRSEVSDTAEPHQSLGEIILPPDVQIDQDEEGLLWTIKTPYVHLVLNARRGLAIKSLAFKSHHFEPVMGTLPQGYFSSIELGADFYSGGVLIEIPGERSRVTDLEWVMPSVRQQGAELLICASIPLAQGVLRKEIVVDVKSERVRLSYNFKLFERPLGIVRVGIMTLLPDSLSLPLAVHCVNGGPEVEVFHLNQEVNHGRAASALVSSTAAFGATDGRLVIKDAKNRRLVFAWNPAECAAIPMLKHQRAQDRYLTRLSFSLCELDDTSCAGGRLVPFTIELSVA